MIISDIQEVKDWFPNNTFQDLSKLSAYLQSAERTYLVPLLGVPLYAHLKSIYPIQHTATAAQKELLQLSQMIVIHFGLSLALPMLNVVINEFGSLTVTENTNQKIASKDRTDKLSDSLTAQAWDAVEQLLLFLEKNSEEFVDAGKKELWKQSEYFWQQTGCLIFTTAELEQAGVYINNSRYRFRKLVPKLRLMERTQIYPAIGKAVTDGLIRRKMEKKLSVEDKELLEYLQTALALYTAETDPELSRAKKGEDYQPNPDKIIADSMISQAKRLLRQHPELYPDYPGNVPDPNPSDTFKNGPGKSIFVLGAGINR